MSWWAVFEALGTLAFELLSWTKVHGGHGSFSSELVIKDRNTGQVIGTLPGPDLTF